MGRFRQVFHSLRDILHGGVIALRRAGCVYFLGRIVSVGRGEILHNLYAATMAVHVAEAADIHQNVEAKLLAG